MTRYLKLRRIVGGWLAEYQIGEEEPVEAFWTTEEAAQRARTILMLGIRG